MIRKPAVAGMFYPSKEKDLSDIVENLLREGKSVEGNGMLKALVVPHAGYVYSGPVAATGYNLLSRQKNKPKTIIMLGQSHYGQFFGVGIDTSDYWETPLGKVKVSKPKNLIENSRGVVLELPQAHNQEHCLEVQLPFLQKILGQFEIIPLVTGIVESEDVANVLLPFLGEDIFLLVSSDLSHYYPYDKAKELDSIANKAIPNLQLYEDFEACGKTAILTVMRIAKAKKWKGKVLDYRNSGDTGGDKSNVVGYGCYGFFASEEKR